MPDEPQTLGNIEPIEIQEEMERSFLDYAMSVITSRALPDARDGLKPVQRRILYGMYAEGMRPDRPHRKSANAVGEVMGKYHPHGDQSIYDALARMAQDFSLRYPLIDGHGNFGSPHDRPAAARYTEARLSALAMELLGEIDENTVDFGDTYDGRNREPLVVPARFPEPLGERWRRHRGRHGHQHPATQPPGGHRRDAAPDRQPGSHRRRPHEVRHRPRLPDRRHDPRPGRHRRVLPHRTRLDPHRAPPPRSRKAPTAARASWCRSCRSKRRWSRSVPRSASS